MKIAILYGTETGNAEMLADDIASALEEAHETSVANLEDTSAEALRGVALNIIACSSYGDGELPASAKPFVARIQADQPDLSGVRFAIFGLGDSEYAETFGHGSMKLAALLTERGAEALGARLVHDAASGEMPEDLAVPWAEKILTELEQG